MPISKRATRYLHSLLFMLPFVIASISWLGFPILATWLSSTLFGYRPVAQPPVFLWSLTVMVYYSWFTLLAIGFGSLFVVAAWLSKRRLKRKRLGFYPMVSFVVPALDEERNLHRCIDSLFRCSVEYPGSAEIIIVDDGSTDITYEIAYAAVHLGMQKHPEVRGRVVRHMTNLGKIEALRSGVNRASGQIVAIVDADSWWHHDSLRNLVEYMNGNGKAAVTGYVHPVGEVDGSYYVVLQQLEYSQGLGVFRCAQALGNAVLVIPGAIGLFDVEVLRDTLNSKYIHSVTEDFEVTLELQKLGFEVGYSDEGRCRTTVPSSFSSFWRQRSRWFLGWLHNTLSIHRDVLLNKRWLSLLVWYCLATEYLGAFIELAAIVSFPFLFWFAPDRILFMMNLLWFGGYALFVGVLLQTIALKFAYERHSRRRLQYHTPFYVILRFVNLMVRVVSMVKYVLGKRGKWDEQHEH